MQKPQALFDTLNHLVDTSNHTPLCLPQFIDDFKQGLLFLNSYTGSLGTFNAYRREIERFFHWSWAVKDQSITAHTHQDIEAFIQFCLKPPTSWIGLKKSPRFINENGLRVPNPAWHPYVATLKKSQIKQGRDVSIEDYAFSQQAVQDVFAILSTFYNFLIANEYAERNPVAMIRQKSKFIRKHQGTKPVRRLSQAQWQSVLDVSEQMADENPEKHERTRFIISALYGMYLRISELAASPRWTPSMNDFHQDQDGQWWFVTVGKGNKQRQIAVSDEMLKSLMRWRCARGLSSLPTPADNSPLLPKLKGQGALSDTAPIRRIVQSCFDAASDSLIKQGMPQEAEMLNEATVHWLRHTGISDDVKHRPREHVRDDAGHSSSATTDRYIDIELGERHQSARHKTLDS